jgi:uncharacterized membrane protein YhiD involved in acid resistance
MSLFVEAANGVMTGSGAFAAALLHAVLLLLLLLIGERCALGRLKATPDRIVGVPVALVGVMRVERRLLFAIMFN